MSKSIYYMITTEVGCVYYDKLQAATTRAAKKQWLLCWKPALVPEAIK